MANFTLDNNQSTQLNLELLIKMSRALSDLRTENRLITSILVDILDKISEDDRDTIARNILDRKDRYFVEEEEGKKTGVFEHLDRFGFNFAQYEKERNSSDDSTS